jgi:predicted Zn-dependent protease
MMQQIQAELWLAEGKQEKALQLLARTAGRGCPDTQSLRGLANAESAAGDTNTSHRSRDDLKSF